MKILITGATGFIGKNLLKYLSKENDVYGTSKRQSSLKNYFIANLVDGDGMEHFPKDFDVIIHCASILANSENCKKLKLLQDNLKITEHLVSLTEEIRPKVLINFSSIGVYPNIDGNYSESSQIKPSVNQEGLYGLSKFCSEEIFSFYFRNSNTRIVNLRLGQTIGEGMRDDRIYSIMKNELISSNSITLYGTGERTSSFLSIDYLMKSLDKILSNHLIRGTFNLTERNLSYLDLAKEIISEFGDSKSQIKFSPKGFTPKVSIDSSKIEELIAND